LEAGLQIASSLDTLFDPNLSSCRQEHSWQEITTPAMMDVRFFTGGLGKLMILDENEVWLCDNRDSCAPAGDMICYVYNEQLERFEALALNSRLQFA